ncbi:MAG: N-acetyl-gamma-glutamyl-phosphate reductase, partial [Fibrobacteria bacterium]|nr:N-acetyl-gamma-glutamyl-phosphate reductase [Fibrobacteria bacterium]
MKTKISVGIIGATAFTGRELITLLNRHSGVKLCWLTSESQKNEDYLTVYPQFNGVLDDNVTQLKGLSAVKNEKPDVVFSCLPHGVSAEFLS